jgi:transcriptional regulator GlxA family with amidase domain
MSSRLDYIDNWDQLATHAHFRVAELARNCGVSERQLRRYFLQRFGISPRDWIMKVRLSRVRGLLAAGKSVKEVAAQVGFNHQSNFSRSFKQHYNATPSSQRQMV